MLSTYTISRILLTWMLTLLPEPNIPSKGGEDGGESDGFTVTVIYLVHYLLLVHLVTTSSKAMVSCTCVSGAVNVGFTDVGLSKATGGPLVLCPLVC